MWTSEDQLYEYPNEALQLGGEKACWEMNPGSRTFDASTLPLSYTPIPGHGIFKSSL